MGQVKKVVLDTNIIISGFIWKGAPREILTLLENQKVANCTSLALMEELQHTLSYPKFKLSEHYKIRVVEFIINNSTLILPKITITDSKDPDDNRVLECAVEAGAECIITGDKGLLSLKECQAVTILSVAEFLNIFTNPNLH